MLGLLPGPAIWEKNPIGFHTVNIKWDQSHNLNYAVDISFWELIPETISPSYSLGLSPLSLQVAEAFIWSLVDMIELGLPP